MTSLASILWAGLRLLYAVFFIIVGVVVVLVLTGTIASPFKQTTAASMAFIDALTASGFINPLLAASYILGGAALLIPKTAPLGLALLAPAVTVIFFFHLLLDGQNLTGGTTAAIWLALAWHFRARFRGLYTL